MATVMSVLLIALKWAAAHPAEVTMALGALSSLLADWMKKRGWTWPAKVASVLAQAGVNLPGLRAEMMTLLPIAEKVVEQKVSK